MYLKGSSLLFPQPPPHLLWSACYNLVHPPLSETIPWSPMAHDVMTDVDDSTPSDATLHILFRGLDCVLRRRLLFPRVQCIYTCSNNNTWLEIIRLMGPVGVASLLSSAASLIWPHKHSSAFSCLTLEELDGENHITRCLKIRAPYPI